MREKLESEEFKVCVVVDFGKWDVKKILGMANRMKLNIDNEIHKVRFAKMERA